MNNLPGKKEAQEQANSPARKVEGNLTTPIQIDKGGVVSEAVTLGAISETAREVSSAASSGQLAGSTGMTHARRQQLEQQIAQVKNMPKEKLIQGISQELHKEIHELQKQARKIQHSFRDFSANQLSSVITKIRQLKEQMATLIQWSVEKLRELYIQLVLKLKFVPV